MNTTQYKVAFGLIGICVLLFGGALLFGSSKNTEGMPITATSTNATSTETTATTTATSTDSGIWKSAIATVFWVGEPSDADNNFIPNTMSAWDEEWQAHYGGVDDPDSRCGSRPCAFMPKENPFYVALPYNDFDDDGNRRNDAAQIPWYEGNALSLHDDHSLVKNHWVAVRYKEKICYGQWEDSGPYEYDDVAYVFGKSATPKNTFDTGAGIDLSPAMRDCLKGGDVTSVEWQFVDTENVPEGAWTKVITTRP